MKNIKGKLLVGGALTVTLLTSIAFVVQANADKDIKMSEVQAHKKEEINKETVKKETPSATSEVNKIAPGTYPYIVLNGFYFAKTSDTVTKEQLGEQIAKVERVGDWDIKKGGDSNEVPPGPIFSIQGKDPSTFIAAKGVVYENGQNKEAYLVFEKREPVENNLNEQSILSAKNDEAEVKIAFNNVKKLLPALYEYKDDTKTTILTSIDYREDFGPGVSLSYRVPSKDTKDAQGYAVQGFIDILQYDKSIKPEASEFSPKSIPEIKKQEGNTVIHELKPIPQPELIQSFSVNNINWGFYKTHFGQYVLRGESNNMIYELKLQGNFKPSDGQILAQNFKQYQ